MKYRLVVITKNYRAVGKDRCPACHRQWRVWENRWSGDRYYTATPKEPLWYHQVNPTWGCPGCDGYTRLVGGEPVWLAPRQGHGNPGAWLLVPRDQ
jgi:hypothetical protein